MRTYPRKIFKPSDKNYVKHLPFRGKTVNFSPPKTGRRTKGKWTGKIVDFVQTRERKTEWGDYCDTIEKLRMDDGEIRLRFGYYRKNANGNYQLAGQTTFLAPPKVAGALIGMAEKRGFFRK